VWHDENVWFAPVAPEYWHGTVRYWNAFGLKVKPNISNSIVVEINIPISGINRSVGALFAKHEDSGDVFLVHRGKIGGGKPGIGKSRFVKWYNGRKAVVVEDGRKPDEVFLITALNDPHLVANVTYFVTKVDEFKTLASESPSDLKAYTNDQAQVEKWTFSAEPTGRKRVSSHVAECSHGRIVAALKKDLESLRQWEGARFVNTQQLDLVVIRADHSVAHIYEIKTDFDIQSVYVGIGQLLFHSLLHPECGKTLVLPLLNAKSNARLSSLSRLGIEILQYKEGPQIRFIS
jgi:hypothetical protein